METPARRQVYPSRRKVRDASGINGNKTVSDRGEMVFSNKNAAPCCFLLSHYCTTEAIKFIGIKAM